jgi:hypothetical protein
MLGKRSLTRKALFIHTLINVATQQPLKRLVNTLEQSDLL